MSIRGDSYGSLNEVAALTRYMLRGESTFNSTTYPTATEVEKFIDRVSGAVNVACNSEGITTPITNSTAKLDADNFVVGKAARFVELTMRGAGSRNVEGETMGSFLAGLHKDAKDFASDSRLGWIRLGVSVGSPKSEGLVFTGETAQADRSDPDNTALAQPKFRRGQFDS
jgi:hypothetical protein